jgi:hypothetical protein
MFERSWREFDLFTARIFRIAERKPAFFTHRLETGVQSCRRTEFALGHHVAHGKAFIFLRHACNELEDLLFERVECGQRRQTAKGFGQLEEPQVNISRAGHDRLDAPLKGTLRRAEAGCTEIVDLNKNCTSMENWRIRLASIISTISVFVVSLWVNQEVFTHSEFVRGVNWIYLPSGVRLLATLLLGADGAIGLLLASWLVDFLYFFPNDPIRSIAGGIIATVAPYATYRLAREHYGLQASLSNLTPKRLLVLALAFSVANPLLTNIWLALCGNTTNIGERFFAMFVGDLSGALIVLYAMKALLSIVPKAAQRT